MPHLIANLPSETDAVRVAGLPLLIWRPENAEKLVLETTQAEFGEDERLPYWAILWPASIALAEAAATLPDIEGKRVLELGAGLGIPGLAAARAGAQVVLTDWYAEPLEFIQSSARLNGLTLETKHLDWRYPPDDAPYDYILGADLVYESRSHAPILMLADKLLTVEGKLLLSDPVRMPGQVFIDTAIAMGWRCEATRHEVEWDGTMWATNIWQLTRGWTKEN